MTYQDPGTFQRTIFIFSLATIGLLAQVSILPGQSNGILASDANVHRAGLKVEWTSQAPVGAHDALIDWELFVDENQPTTTFEVTTGNRREIISSLARDARGEVFGIEDARSFAEIRQEVITAELKIRGVEDVEVVIKEYQRPLSTIYLLTRSGEVSAVDADTGKTRWLHRTGESRFPSIGLGANAKYVGVVNGSSLYCLEAATGKQLWSKRCKYAVGSSPAVTDDKIMVPLTDGRLEVFPMESQGLGSFALVALGEGTAQPLVTASTISWPTTRGELNVYMRGNRNHSISYRLRSGDAIVSSATEKDGTLFVGSLDGFLYAVDEVRGATKWEISLGASVSQSPAPIGKYVYAVSDDGKLYKADAESGRAPSSWREPVPDVRKFAGAGVKNLYAFDRLGNLLVIDRKSKGLASSAPVGEVDLVLNNYQTDRLYIGNQQGTIQCLREIASEHPYFHADEVAQVEDTAENMPDDERRGIRMKTPPTEDENPFATEKADEDNPFGPSTKAEPDQFEDDEPADTPTDDEEDPFK